MSNVGQALTAIAGGIIGFFVGAGPTGALYGFEIGLLAGTVLSPTRLPGVVGPRISDGNTTTASIGGAVVFGLGVFTVSGTVMYLGELQELSTTVNQSQKGSPVQSQTTFSYTQSIGIGLSEPINELRRIWENGQLVYDERPHQPDEDSATYTARKAASDKYKTTFVLYKGDEAQLPDPTIEADKGVGLVPAYRGLAYIMFPDRGLRDDQGQRHPTFKVEIYVGANDSYDNTIPVPLSTIINSICARCGYDVASQIDSSSLDSTTVNGYSIQNVMSGRDALVPIRSVGFWDCVESGLKLRFVKRGGAPLRTLSLSDLGTYADSSDSNVGPAVSKTQQQEVELPRQVRVTYISSDNDYEQGQQLSPQRFDTNAVNVTDVELAVVMNDDQALQTAEVLWADAWSGSDTYTTAVDQSQADIEPSDALLLPFQGSNFRVRVVKVNDASQVMRSLTLVSDDDGSYVSEATANQSDRPVQSLTASSGSVLELLDIPALQDQDSDAGFYVFAYGDGTGNKWSGSTIYKSTDGSVFNNFAAASGSPPFGTLDSDLSASVANPWDWDDSNIITVQMDKGGFESRDDASVLAGANTIAIGADGRWEIIQFGVATAVGVGGATWELSHLLRGRRGTEHNIGTALLDDRIVGLTMGNLYRLSMQNSEIGALRTYKAVTTGNTYDSGTDFEFTGHAEALKPFSPVFIEGEFSGFDFVISWTRRDRLSQTLQSGVTLPNSDMPESYTVDIYSGPSVVRSLTSSTPTVTYTSSQITADFGSAPSTFHVKVYQMSTIVGKGYPGDAVIP